MDRFFRLSPPKLYKICIGIMVLSLTLPFEGTISFPYNFSGIALFIVGALLALSAKQLFKKTATPLIQMSVRLIYR